MSRRLLIALAVLVAASPAGRSQDKNETKAPDAASRPRKARWEYKTLRADELGEPRSDALNKLGDEGWELVSVEVPPARPVVNGTTLGEVRPRPPADASWKTFAKDQDKIDLNRPENADNRVFVKSRGVEVPPDGILTKEKFAEGYGKWAAAREAAQKRAMMSTYYFKRVKE